MRSIESARLIDAMPGVRWVLWLITAVIVTMIVWAAFARVDVITRADARIVPDGHLQMIASLEGGILREILVKEGMAVAAGQALARLDDTRAGAVQNEAASRQRTLLAAEARLVAELEDREPSFPAALDDARELVEGERETWRIRKRVLDDARQAYARSIELAQSELTVATKLSNDGLMPKVELMRLRRQLNELELQSQERVNRFRQDVATELVRVRGEMSQLAEQLVLRDDTLARTVLRSPVAGLVKRIQVATVGGVVAAGQSIMEIVPLDGPVRVEARLLPADVGFVREGQNALIKLSAYEYTTYGSLDGRIEYIGPDAIADEAPGRTPGGSYYRATLSTDPKGLRFNGEALALRPGMTGTVEITTSDRTVLSFLLRPLLRGREAFRAP
ncbi:MAG: HlyD family type I secretion periplasmic adaptor subunit [Burkholderiaceae bacterium]